MLTSPFFSFPDAMAIHTDNEKGRCKAVLLLVNRDRWSCNAQGVAHGACWDNDSEFGSESYCPDLGKISDLRQRIELGGVPGVRTVPFAPFLPSRIHLSSRRPIHIASPRAFNCQASLAIY